MCTVTLWHVHATTAAIRMQQRFICIADLHVAVNNMTVAMETQEWAPFALLFIYEIFPTAVNNTYEVRASCETPDVFV